MTIEHSGRMTAAGPWLVVDEDGRGDAVRQAVSAQAPMIDARDSFSARRILDAESIGGVIVVVGRRTLSLRAFCVHVRRERPGVAIIAIRHPDVDDDAALLSTTTAVIDDGPTEVVTERLASVSGAFDAGEATAVLPPRLGPRPARPPVLATPPSAAAHAMTSTSTKAAVVAPPPPLVAMPVWNATPLAVNPTAAAAARTEKRAGVVRAAPPVSASPASAHPPEGEDANEVTAVMTSGPDLEHDAVTETHVVVSVGSSVEESREPLAGAGPELLVGIAARCRTGRLIVADGEGAGIIRFLEGVPVGVELPTGDAGLYRWLVASGVLPAGTRPPIVRQGQLLEALVLEGLLDVDGRARFERSVLRGQILALSRQAMVRAVFVAATSAAQSMTTPINVFGLIVEARRRSVAPEVIHALYDEIAGWQITGTLLLLALRSAGLIDVEGPAATTAPWATNPRGMSPRQLLGVGIAPDEDEIESAYIAHVERIAVDLARTFDESKRAQLTTLRERLDVAREALRLQLGFATGTSSNPF